VTVNNPLRAPLGNAPVVTDFTRRVYCVLGLPFDAVDTEQTVELLLNRAEDGDRCFFSTPNLNFLIADHDPRRRGDRLRTTAHAKRGAAQGFFLWRTGWRGAAGG
jgi:hypothetical protein